MIELFSLIFTLMIKSLCEQNITTRLKKNDALLSRVNQLHWELQKDKDVKFYLLLKAIKFPVMIKNQRLMCMSILILSLYIIITYHINISSYHENYIAHSNYVLKFLTKQRKIVKWSKRYKSILHLLCFDTISVCQKISVLMESRLRRVIFIRNQIKKQDTNKQISWICFSCNCILRK